MLKIQPVPLIVVFLALGACVSHNIEPGVEVDCTGFQTVSFSGQIQPIVNAKCAIPDCHNGDNGSDINWTDPVKLKNHASEARRRVALPEPHADHMPASGELSLDEIKLIVCWVEQGAPINN